MKTVATKSPRSPKKRSRGRPRLRRGSVEMHSLFTRAVERRIAGKFTARILGKLFR